MALSEGGLVSKNPQNNSNGHFIHNYSSFPDSLSRSRAYTARFGEYTPSFVFDGVEKDEISVNSVDRIDSYSLNAPFKGSIRKIKESFCVPKMALLPLNWDRIYVQPANGDDVPKDANCVFLSFPERFYYFWSSMHSAVLTAPAVTDFTSFIRFATACMRMLVVGEYVYSEGSLLAYCGYHGNAQIVFDKSASSYDDFFDSMISSLFSNIIAFTVDYGDNLQKRYYGRSGSRPDSVDYVNINTLRDFLADFRENPSGSIVGIEGTAPDYAAIYNSVINTLNGYSFKPYLPYDSEVSGDDLKDMLPTTLNLSRILSYQMLCHHFYSNSGVDFLYTAELYRQYMYSLHRAVGAQTLTFDWNGMNCPYDYLSGHVLERQTFMSGGSAPDIFYFDYELLSASAHYDYDVDPNIFRLCSLAAIFSFRRSLRFSDYFVGSRTRPLAPFNSDVSVNNDRVSVIDITKRIQGQRFANSVMRVRSKIENYVKGLFGSAPAPDYHNPFFLAREEEVIYGDEVQNTAEKQFASSISRTGLMSSNSGRYTFTFHNDDNHPCIYIQIISFDIRRHYTKSVDRHFLQVDRYDMFNPDFQYIGDQPVYGIELGFPDRTNQMIPGVFGYQGRDMEYKQSFDIALGGAISHLPGWFMTDKAIGKSDDTPHIDSDFIRSYPSELDPFYLSLTGYSLATYFHFIINTINRVDAKRAMAVDPQILA